MRLFQAEMHDAAIVLSLVVVLVASSSARGSYKRHHDAFNEDLDEGYHVQHHRDKVHHERYRDADKDHLHNHHRDGDPYKEHSEISDEEHRHQGYHHQHHYDLDRDNHQKHHHGNHHHKDTDKDYHHKHHQHHLDKNYHKHTKDLDDDYHHKHHKDSDDDYHHKDSDDDYHQEQFAEHTDHHQNHQHKHHRHHKHHKHSEDKQKRKQKVSVLADFNVDTKEIEKKESHKEENTAPSKIPQEELDLCGPGKPHYWKRSKVHFFKTLANQTPNDHDDEALQVNFYSLRAVYGWTTLGLDAKPGNKKYSNRKGVVVSYTAQYSDKENAWMDVSNPDDNKKEFLADGNIAKPAESTEVSLRSPIVAKAIRFIPKYWDGDPIMKFNIKSCLLKESNQDRLNMRNATNKTLSQMNTTHHRKIHLTSAKPVHANQTSASSKSKPPTTAAPSSGKQKTMPSGKHNQTAHTSTKAAGKDTSPVPPPSSRQCTSSPLWRYSTKPLPRDDITASHSASTAWRAYFGLNVSPYEFPYFTKFANNKMYLEVNFGHQVKLSKIKTIGSSEAWGMVTKFVLAFVDSKGQWLVVRDEGGSPRVFDAGPRTQKNSGNSAIFRFQNPVVTHSFRIYPEDWVGKALLKIDVYACKLV